MNHILFSLLRTSIWGEDKFPLNISQTDIDWSAIYQELKHQTVQNLPVELLCRLDPTHKNSYVNAASLSMSRFYMITNEQQKLYQLFRDAHIPFVVLKGAAAACYYPHPEYRCMGDIDLLVKPKDFESAYALMEENGYLADEDNAKDERHAHFRKNNVLYELHHFFALLNDGEQAGTFDSMLYSAIDRAEDTVLNIFAFPKLPDLENGLVLLAHLGQHLEGGLGLRQIVDWMLYVDQKLDDPFWNTAFQKAAQALSLDTLAITVTRMCQLYLGLSDRITWCSQADETLCHELMQLTLDRGNFGRKLSFDSQKSQDTLLAFRGVRQFFSRLQYRGCKNWKLLEKWPALKPFAWLYQLFRYTYRGLKRKHPLRQLAADIRDSRKNEDIFSRLGIARHGEGFHTPKGTRW